MRRLEFELHPAALEELASVLQLTRKAVDQYRAGDDRYSHLAESDIEKVERSTEQTHKWVEDKRVVLAGTPCTQNPPVTVSQIRQEKQTFENTVNPILTKPKPKADPPPPPSVNKDNDSTVDNKDGQEDNTSKQEQREEKMDVE